MLREIQEMLPELDLSVRFFDRTGAEISEIEAASIDRNVGREEILDGVAVSTHFIGQSMGSLVIMFETMIILEDGEELGCKRTATETEARIAHIEMIELARQKLGLEVS